MANTAEFDLDMSELSGRAFTCDLRCGLCCLCQPELLPNEIGYFRKNYPTKIVNKESPHKHVAIALKKGQGPCEFLDKRKCSIYSKRPHFCRQFPFHIYLGDRVQVELDLSCRGVWTGKGEDALVVGGQMVEDNIEVIAAMLKESRSVYREFQHNCEEDGVWKSPLLLRKEMGAKIDHMSDLQFLAKVLELSSEEDEMQLPSSPPVDFSVKDIEESARETGLDSLSSEEPFSLPVYCDKEWRWNIFSSKNGKIEQLLLKDDGDLELVRSIDASQVKLLLPEAGGKELFTDYFRTLNARDSMLGYAYYLVDDYGYEDYVGNTYFGMMAATALDLLWRSSLIAFLRKGRLDRDGVMEGIISYDMDRLDAPTIGAFI